MKKAILPLIVTGMLGATVGTLFVYFSKRIKKEATLHKRYRAYYNVANQWLAGKNDNVDFAEYFNKNGYNSIAIYGLGTLGELLHTELKKTDVKVAYFIDKNPEDVYNFIDETPVIGLDELEEQSEKPDVIIVTPVYDYDEIYEDLTKTGTDIEIISLEDVVY